MSSGPHPRICSAKVTPRRPRWAIPLVLAGLFTLMGCTDDATRAPVGAEPEELRGEVVVEGLPGPTQLAIGPDGRWWVALLNGGENENSGQVVTIDPAAGEPVVVVDGLDKPTGIALFGDQLWIMERDRLTRGPLDGSDRLVVADDLPTNGRSEGTLTVDGDQLLFDTSGRITDGEVVEDSGILWAATADGEYEELASGFKHAYAHARSADGTLYTTEVADGRFDGEIPADELVAVTPGLHHGWPQCVGDNQPVAEYGGEPSTCDPLPSSTALFGPGATPTSVVFAPWDDELALVALWNESVVVALNPDDPGATPEVVYQQAQHPQHLTVDGDRVLLTDHTSGTIIALSPAS